MTSARRLWWLHATLLGVGALGVAAALVAVARMVDFELPSAAELAAACRQYALPALDGASAFVLVIGSAGLAAVALTARSGVRGLRASRCLKRSLPVTGAGPTSGTLLIDDDRPLAFCAGLLRPRVYVSRGALSGLRPDELAAVLTHEAHHARRRDPMRLLVARSLGEGLFFLPALRRLADRYAALAEVAADEAAVRATGSPAPLAAALLLFEAQPSPVAVGIAPERVDHLMGTQARWELPALLIAGSAVIAATVLALSLGMAAHASRVSVGLPQLAAQACMLAMAGAPLVLGAAALLGGRRLANGR